MFKQYKQPKNGFTIVELLIVIVVIGILSAITLISYDGISDRAVIATIKSDLSNDSKLLELYKVEHDTYPATLDPTTNCPDSPFVDDQYCLKVSYEDADLAYVSDGDVYSLTITDNVSTISYEINSGGEPIVADPDIDPEASPNNYMKAIGGTSYDVGKSVVQTSDGGYAITGGTESFGNNYSDMFIAKYDSDLELTWINNWGGNFDDSGNSIIQTSDGGYAVTGNTCGFTDPGASCGFGAGEQDMFIVKYDSDGEVVWNRTWDGDRFDTGGSIAQTVDGGYVITGETGGNQGLYVVKFSDTGVESWNKTWGGTGYIWSNSITPTSDGGCAVVGYTSSYGAGNRDMFIIKYDLNGNVSWDKTWGGTGVEYGNSVVQTSDGGYAVTGTTFSFDGVRSNVFIVKYDSSGGLSWNKTWGGTDDDYGSSIVQTSNGGYAVTGYTYSFGAGGIDMFIAKFTSAGNISWDKTWGGTNDDFGNSLVQTSDEGYAVVGYTESFGAGYEDIFIVKYNSTGGISNCPNDICKNPNAASASPSAFDDPVGASVSTLVADISTPTANIYIPNVTKTTIAPVVVPDVPAPDMTVTFSSQELYVAWPGDAQTVCKEWTVPGGNTIKGFLVSQETEEDYDYFIVSSDEVEVYNMSGVKTDVYVDISSSPGTTLSACMSTDESEQGGYGGEVTGVLYSADGL